MSALSVFRHGSKAKPRLGVDGLVDSMQTARAKAGRFATPELAGRMISMESFTQMGADVENVARQSAESLSTSMEEMISSLNNAYSTQTHAHMEVKQSQKDAAVIAGMLAYSPEQFWDAVPSFESLSAPTNGALVGVYGSTSLEKRLSMESYDDRNNKSVVEYSVIYNMTASRQNEFGEAFFPTVVVTPDQTGYSQSVRLIQVYNEVRRNVNGSFQPNWYKRNIIHAFIDPTILQNDTTKIYPVYQPAAAANFMDQGLLAAYDVVTDDGETVSTAPLAVGVEFDLMGLSQRNALLQTGILDSTDAIDNAILLENVYMVLGTTTKEVFKFPVKYIPSSNFVASAQGLDRQMQLNFITDSLPVTPAILTASGAASTNLATLVSNGASVRLSVRMSGYLNTQLGQTQVFSANVTVASVTDSSGNKLGLDSGEGLTIANLFESAVIEGYDLDARLSNLNRRQRGQLLDVSTYTQIYQVPLLAPITVPRPLTNGNATDASDLAALITTTQIRTSNSAVAELENVAGMLQQYTAAMSEDNGILNFSNGTYPPLFGVGAYLVQPFFSRETLNVVDVIDSLTSSQRFEDIRNAIVNKIRDKAYRMYRDSGYKAAADAVNGGVAPPPILIIGTDPVIMRYLIVDGDLRTAGITFDVKIVESLNINVKDKIYLAFGTKAGMDGTPDPLHFGNMAWKPELTIVLPLHRNGANSKELTVCPSYRHFVNMPVLSVLDIEGIELVIDNKVSINVNEMHST